jgi:hypothetical protein
MALYDTFHYECEIAHTQITKQRSNGCLKEKCQEVLYLGQFISTSELKMH